MRSIHPVLFHTILAVALLFMISGCSSPYLPSSGESSTHTNVTYTVGEAGPAGGTILYDKGYTSEEWRYIEAAPHDLSRYNYSPLEWGGYGILTGAGETAIGTGRSNSKKIDNSLRNELNPATICLNIDINGYTDWFLPSKETLNTMYSLRDTIGNLSYTYYWSSSEVDSYEAWSKNILTGATLSDNKKLPSSIRPVRSF